MHIAVDLDDVTVDFWRGVLDAFHDEFGGAVMPDMHPWGEEAKRFAKHELFKKAGYKDWWGFLRDRPERWSQFPPVPGALGSIRQLRNSGHYIEAVTSKPEWAEHVAYRWVGDRHAAFNQVTVITNGQEKRDYTDADIIIDDKLETIESFRDDYRDGIWFNRAWEGAAEAQARGIFVAGDWAAVVDRIDIIEMEADLVQPAS